MFVVRQCRAILRMTPNFRFQSGIESFNRSRFNFNGLFSRILPFQSFRNLTTIPDSLEDIAQSKSTSDEFQKLGLDLSIINRLKALSIVKPTWIQNEAIPLILKGIDKTDFVIGAETGSGKTYTYLTPIIQTFLSNPTSYRRNLINVPVVIIVVPTRPLCQQVARFGYDICSGTDVTIGAVLSGDNTAWPFSKHFKPSPDILVGTPAFLTRFISQDNPIFPLLQSQVRFVVFDEADIVLQGDSGATFIQSVIRSFRSPIRHSTKFLLCAATIPSIGTLSVDANTRKLFPSATWIFNSAKMHRIHPLITVEFVDMKGNLNLKARMPLIERRSRLHVGLELSLQDYKKKIFRKKQKLRKLKGFDDNNNSDDLDAVILVDDHLKDERKLNGNQVIIFTNTIEACEMIYNQFSHRERGLSDQVCMFHSDMDNHIKDSSLELFRLGKKSILICTDVISRGIDVVAVSLVIQAEFPRDAVQYLHRSGRCSRGGRLGHCVCYVDDNDRELATEIMRRERESLEGIFSRKRSFRRNIKREDERKKNLEPVEVEVEEQVQDK